MSVRRWLQSRRLIRWIAVAGLLLIVLSGITVGQRGFRRRGRIRNLEEYKQYIQEIRQYSGIPKWQIEQDFKHDTFTFVRIQYDSMGGWGWRTDHPDSDWNFSYRLQELTSLQVDPDGKILRLTDDELFNYPWIYIIEPGYMYLDDREVVALRKYLLSGGFLMVDDFWGEREWWNFYAQIKRVFPDREPIELSLDHEIFHCVYDLEEKPQIPSIGHARSGRSYERYDAREPHYKAIFDDNDRMMAIICHNTDLGDGWEREGDDPYYFKEYSEKKAYPLGINIVVYAMTH